MITLSRSKRARRNDNEDGPRKKRKFVCYEEDLWYEINGQENEDSDPHLEEEKAFRNYKWKKRK